MKKTLYQRTLALFVSVMMILTGIPILSITASAEGTDWTGYTAISTKEELNAVRNGLSGKYYLTQDIVFTAEDFAEGGAFYNGGAGWTPIGTSSAAFIGIFDGNNHIIKGLNININASSTTIIAGLFRVSNGIIKNLGMVDNVINVFSNVYYANIYVGSIVGEISSGNISNCYNTGCISATITDPSSHAYAGGIAGFSLDIISNCYNTGNISATTDEDSSYANAGGIVGETSNNGNITNCYNTGKISATTYFTSSKSYAGGIAGHNNDETINNCYNTGIISSNDFAGGIIGYTSGNIINCYNTGNIDLTLIAGGIAGFSAGTIDNCYNTASISSTLTTQSGGIVGDAYNAIINNCYNTGSISAISFAGGIVGCNYSGAIYRCYNVGSIKSATNSGGILGYRNIGTISTCYYLNNISKGVGSGTDNTLQCTEEEMKQQITFVGFDFENIWTIDGTASYALPQLKNILLEHSPYVPSGFSAIYTAQDLANVENNLAGNYILMNDIDLSSYSYWEPLGDTFNRFSGVFDGNNYSICKMNISCADSEFGLFQSINYDGTVKNLTIKDSTINLECSGHTVFGTIAAYNSGLITNCSVDIAISIVGQSTITVGGIVGGNYGTISFCKNNSTITQSNNAVLENCSFGGIAGGNGIAHYDEIVKCGTVLYCYNMGGISLYQLKYTSVGGIVGTGTASTTALGCDVSTKYCYNIGTISVTNSSYCSYVGGIIGWGGIISDCFNMGRLNSDSYTGGIVGYLSCGYVNCCYNVGDTFYGVVAIKESRSIISNCYYLDTSATQSSSYGVSMTGVKLRNANNLCEFDFNNIWTLAGDKYYLYPELQSLNLITNKVPITSAAITISGKAAYNNTLTAVVDNVQPLNAEYTIQWYREGQAIDGAVNNEYKLVAEDIGKSITVEIAGKGVYSGAVLCPQSLVPIALTGIEVTTKPDKLTYIEGTTLDTTGIELKLSYDNGTTETVTSGWSADYDFSTVGTKTVTINYEGKSATFEATVIAKSLADIKVTTEPNKMVYIEGTALDTTGAVLKLLYDNGTTENITSGWTLDYDFSTVGTKTVTINYGGKSATFDVTVIAKTLSSIEVSTLPTKSTYVEGTPLNTADMVMTLHFNNNTSETVTSGWTTVYDFGTIGTKTVTVSYGGKNTTFNVAVVEKSLSSIEVASTPTKLTYIESTALDTSGMVLTLHYDNNTSQTVTSGWTTNYNFSTVGTKNVTVSYGGKTTTFDVTIIAKSLTGIEVAAKPNKLSYIVNTALDTTGMVLKLTYDNGTTGTITSGWTANYDFNTEGTKTVTINYEGKSSSFEAVVRQVPTVSVSYRTHVQDFGWQDYVSNGNMSGTAGQSKRLEGINISVSNNSNLGISYSTHVQDIGWQGFVSDGAMSGTQGQSKRLEAIKIKLTGSDADLYDVYYRVHAENYGWLSWTKNGTAAGTEGFGLRLEAIQIMVVKKTDSVSLDTSNPFVSAYGNGLINYRTHVQDFGWQSFVGDGGMSGTQGESKRLEGINIRLSTNLPIGSVVYSTHVQDIGWMNEVSDGALSGTQGQSKRLEAITIRLTGEIANQYDIYYRVHAQNVGWMGWAKNGERAGTAGFSYRLEGIQIVLVPKGGSAPGSTENAFIQG